MHTKEQRLRYGEQLRKQILLKEEKKRSETLQKRKYNQPVPNSNFTTANQRQYQQPSTFNNIETRNQPIITPQTQIINKKEVYQKKLEEQAYFPFGRMGGGAPTRRRDDKPKVQQQQQQIYQPVDYSSQPISQPSQPNIQNFGPPQYYNQPYSQPYKDTNQNIPQQYQQYPQPINYSYSQQQIPQYPPQAIQNPQYQLQYQQQQYYPPSMDPQYQFQTSQNHVVRESYQNQNPTYVQQNKPSSQQQISRIREQVGSQQQLQPHDKLKKGARNILSYQNLLPEQVDQKALKQKAAQRQLLLQIQQKQRQKRQEKERIRLEDLKLEQENNRYKLEQKRKIEQQQNKKRIQEEAKRQNEEKARQMRERLEKQAAEQKKRKRMQIPQYQPPRQVIKSRQNNHPIARNRRQQKHVQPQPQPQPQSEQVDYRTVEKAFNTEISRDFIQQQKQKDQQRRIKDKQFNELKRNLNNMKEQVITHNQLYKLQVQKAKLEIQRMRLQKIKAEQEVMKLKEQLKVKKDDRREDNYRYANTRSRQDHYRLKNIQTIQDDYQQLPPPKPLRPKQQQVFVKKTYSYEAKQSAPKKPQNNNQKQYPINPNIGTQFQQGLQSLYGETVKIPVNISNDKFSMSNIDQFDIKRQSPQHQQQQKQKQQYRNYQQPIEEQIEDPVRRQFRKHLSGQDELDKFVKQPKAPANKWGQMSSIDSNGTKQIEQLLRQQQQYQYPSQNPSRSQSRPKSKLSNIGKQSLAGGNLGYGADGFTLQSNNNDGTYNTNMNDGTFNLMKINENNDRRLSRLRQMGIETVGQDQEIGKLDKLLDKYSN